MSTSSSRKRGRSLHCQSACADGLVERFAAWQRRHAWRHLDAVERVWAISDLHMEHEANFDFMSGLAGFERDALVVVVNGRSKFKGTQLSSSWQAPPGG